MAPALPPAISQLPLTPPTVMMVLLTWAAARQAVTLAVLTLVAEVYWIVPAGRGGGGLWAARAARAARAPARKKGSSSGRRSANDRLTGSGPSPPHATGRQRLSAALPPSASRHERTLHNHLEIRDSDGEADARLAARQRVPVDRGFELNGGPGGGNFNGIVGHQAGRGGLAAGGLSGGDGDGQIEYIGYGRGAAGGALIGLASSEASGWYDVVAEPVARVANRGHREGDVGHRASVGLAVARLWLQRGCDRFKEGGRAGRRQADKQAGRQAAGRQAFRHQEGTRR